MVDMPEFRVAFLSNRAKVVIDWKLPILNGNGY